MRERLCSALGPGAPGRKAVGERQKAVGAETGEALHPGGAWGQQVIEWVTARGAEGPVTWGPRVA